jgi:hypothetical protein
LKQLHRPGDPEILAGTTLVLLAAIAGEGVECPSRDLRSLVVKRSKEGREGLFVDEAIEEVDTEASHHGLSMPKPALDGGSRWRT